jgi:cell division protein FtsW (lipid II flippase)
MKIFNREIDFNTVTWLNLNLCVCITVLYFGYIFVIRVMNIDGVESRYGPFAGRALTSPLVVISLVSLLWYFLYRERKNGSRLFAFLTSAAAGIVGLVMFVNADLGTRELDTFVGLVMFVNADLGTRELDTFKLLILLYIIISHLLLAIFGNTGNTRRQSSFVFRDEDIDIYE